MNYKLIELLNSESEFIFDNETSFMKEFCDIKYPDLIGVTFNSHYVHFVYWNTVSGEHFSDSVRITEYDKWKERIIDD